MIKLLSTLAIASASILPISAANAQTNWASFVAQRVCVHLRSGHSVYDSSYNAGMDTVGTRYQAAFIQASRNSSSQELGMTIIRKAHRICPSALANASNY